VILTLGIIHPWAVFFNAYSVIKQYICRDVHSFLDSCPVSLLIGFVCLVELSTTSAMDNNHNWTRRVNKKKRCVCLLFSDYAIDKGTPRRGPSIAPVYRYFAEDFPDRSLRWRDHDSNRVFARTCCIGSTTTQSYKYVSETWDLFLEGYKEA